MLFQAIAWTDDNVNLVGNTEDILVCELEKGRASNRVIGFTITNGQYSGKIQRQGWLHDITQNDLSSYPQSMTIIG